MYVGACRNLQPPCARSEICEESFGKSGASTKVDSSYQKGGAPRTEATAFLDPEVSTVGPPPTWTGSAAPPPKEVPAFLVVRRLAWPPESGRHDCILFLFSTS